MCACVYEYVRSVCVHSTLLLYVPLLWLLQGTKAIMKDVAKYLPGIGWTFMFMEYPFLKRDWVTDKTVLEKSCRNLSDYPVNMLVGISFSLFLPSLSSSLFLPRSPPYFLPSLPSPPFPYGIFYVLSNCTW